MSVVIRGGTVQFLQARPGDGPKPPKRPPCSYCGKPEHKFAATPGWSVGSSPVLRDNMVTDPDIKSHPWYTGLRTLAAHHLICTEAMDDDDWPVYCFRFGYDINCARNGVILPSVPAVACELHVPVHVGPHSAGWAYDVNLAYPDAVKGLLDSVAGLLESGSYCADPDGLARELDRVSATILRKLAGGQWTITTDGLDYLPGGIGCSGVRSIQDKPRQACPKARRHGHQHGQTGAPLQRRALQVGV